MNQTEKALHFSTLHVRGSPLLLYNVWDAGSAGAVASAGATAIATSSWSVAAAQGFDDGETVPLDFHLAIVSRIAATIDLPLTVDFESGYAEHAETIADNITRVIEAGAIGINIEDQRIGGSGLYETDIQQQRIAAVRRAAEAAGIPLFINARTDLFLKTPDHDRDLIATAALKAHAYQAAGADGFFAPGLADGRLISELCETVPLPVNIMIGDGAPGITELAAMGVARISCGPAPHITAMAELAGRCRAFT